MTKIAEDATLERRRKNFYKYYKSHPDKLKGKSLDEAYSAMRREVGRQENTARSAREHRRSNSAVDRRVASRGVIAAKQDKNGKTIVKTEGRSDWHYPVEAGPKGPRPSMPMGGFYKPRIPGSPDLGAVYRRAKNRSKGKY